MELQLESELNASAFPEVGRPTAAYRRGDGEFVALSGAFGSPSWYARSAGWCRPFLHRLCLYDGNLKNRIAICDEPEFPVNDVAFHPSRPILAIATGSYDGGYMFEGDLWLWNWESGETANLLKESREVARCRFDAEGKLSVLLRPRNEEEFGTFDDEVVWQQFVGIVIDDFRDRGARERRFGEPDPRLKDLPLVKPGDFGFVQSPKRHEEQRDEALFLLESTGKFEQRAIARDFAWIDDERIGCVHDHCLVEVWNTRDARRERIERGEGCGVQIFGGPDSPLINVLTRGFEAGRSYQRSTIFELTPSDLREIRGFDRAVAMSRDRSGNFLCRGARISADAKQNPKFDVVLNAAFEELFAGDLGHYDPFNHYIRIDDTGELLFLRSSPPDSVKHKKLCTVSASGDIDERCAWDTDGEHRMCSTARAGPDGSLFASFEIHHPEPGKGKFQIVKREFRSGRTIWVVSVSDLVGAMALVGDSSLVFALNDGTLGVIDTERGQIAHQHRVIIDGVATVPLSLAAKGSTIAVGTLDGRILLYQLR